MKKTKDEKEKYRKKSRIKNKPSKNKRSIELLKFFRKFSKYYPDDKRFQLYVELGNAGVDLSIIEKALFDIPQIWKKKTGTMDMKLSDFKTCYRSSSKRGDDIRKAFNSLCNLKPVLQGYTNSTAFNKALADMQSKLRQYKPLIKEYTDWLLIEANIKPLNNNEKATLLGCFSPELIRKLKSKKSKPATQSTHGLWKESTGLIVNELQRIDYSKKSAYSITAEILKLNYPEIYKNDKPELVRSRHSKTK